MSLVVRDASFGYDKGNPVQSHVSFNVAGGEVCCVLGPNGCGKSTLIKTILGMSPLFSGSITFNGEDMTKWKARRLSRSVAYVAQVHDRPFPYLVREVVMLGRSGKIGALGGQPTRKDKLIVENALEDMGIRHLRDVPYSEVSGGELQLVMFARALAQEAELMILDEPTAALDYGNAVRVIEKIRELSDGGQGVMMVTHDPDHAFMTRANVVLFKKDQPMVFGPSYDVITRRNIQDAYGVNVKLVEFTHDNQEVMRTCAPEFGGWSSE